MPNLIETAKAATIAYNDKNWDKANAIFDEKGVYDEKATGRRIQGIGQIIEAWQGWSTAIPDSKATFVGARVTSARNSNGSLTSPDATPGSMTRCSCFAPRASKRRSA